MELSSNFMQAICIILICVVIAGMAIYSALLDVRDAILKKDKR